MGVIKISNGSEGVFEEWNAYARRKVLKPRAVGMESMEANSVLKIIGITGIRRSGKTSVLMLLLQKLVAEGRNAAYINVEDNRLGQQEDVLDGVIRWFGDVGCLLLDEVTYAKDWEGWLARNHELLKGGLHVFVSSSRKNLAVPSKPLRGRMLVYEIYPLSFAEFLRFRDITADRTTAGAGRLDKAFHEYLLFGGFPEVVLIEDATDKVRNLNSYFKDIIGLDVAEISKESISIVELFGKYVINTPYFSASKCLNFIKGLGYKIGKQSILELEKCSHESYLLFFVPIFSRGMKDRLQYPRKAYMGDTGFMYAVSGKTDMGRIFENAVFLELKRRIHPQQEINYWKNRVGSEADFVIREGLYIKEIIQVVYSLDDKKTKEREVRGLVACAIESGLKHGLVITNDFESTENVDGIDIKFIPMRKWLLDK